MWKTYRNIIQKYPKISLQEERRLIRKAKKGSKQAANELVLRHMISDNYNSRERNSN